MDLIKVRRDLHMIPEIGMCEYETKKYIMNLIKDFNCKIYEIGETGIVLFFDYGKKESICFRCDMDALPIKEENDIPYKSKNVGVMHACAHDAHMAITLGFSEYINNEKPNSNYNIVILFQPSEEIIGGSKLILDSKILDTLNVKCMFGLHLWPGLEYGKVFSMKKGMLAQAVEVDIDFIGKSVHAANRKDGIDSIFAASKYLTKIYELSDEIKKRHLMNFGFIEGGTLRNIVAGKTTLKATMRSFDEETFDTLKNNLYKVKEEIEREFPGLTIEIKFSDVLPLVYNNEEFVDKMNFLNILDEPFMQAEDFGIYTNRYKSLYMLLGIGNTEKLHTSKFDFDDKVLYSGLEAFKTTLKLVQ